MSASSERQEMSDNEDISDSDTGDNDMIWLVLLNAAACLIIYLIMKKKKTGGNFNDN